MSMPWKGLDMYGNDHITQTETANYQPRWMIETRIGGVMRKQEFAHELAAEEALAIAGEHRARGVAAYVTLRLLRKLAIDSLHGAKEISDEHHKTLQAIHVRLE